MEKYGYRFHYEKNEKGNYYVLDREKKIMEIFLKEHYVIEIVAFLNTYGITADIGRVH